MNEYFITSEYSAKTDNSHNERIFLTNEYCTMNDQYNLLSQKPSYFSDATENSF